MSVNVEEIRATARLLLAAEKWRDLTQLLEHDIPILIAEVGRLREELAEAKHGLVQPRISNSVVPRPSASTAVRSEGKLLNLQQFGDEIGIKVATVRSWVLKHKISVVRVGRLVRVPRTEVERIMKEGLTPARLTRDS
jgi:excisionase family DNA binding protein